MRKRLFTLLAMFILSLTCVSFTGCGNKYDKLQFEIAYAFDEDSNNWHTVEDNSMVLHYGADGDELTLNEGVGYVYFKVNVKNVDNKYLDTINVAGESINLNIQPNGTFKYLVHEDEVVNTRLTFTEYMSQKKANVDFAVYESLQDLTNKPSQTNKEYFSVPIGGKINLADLNNLQYTPDDTKTDQTAVTYTAESIGYYTAGGEYTATLPASEVATYVSINDIGILSFNNERTLMLDSQRNVIKIRATSVDHDTISTEFDVFLSEIVKQDDSSAIYTPTVFADDSKTEEKTTVDLYATDKPEYSQHATTTVYLEYDKLETSVYSTTGGVYTEDGSTLNYSVEVEVDGKPYDLTTSSGNFENSNYYAISTEDSHHFTITSVSDGAPESIIKFNVKVKGLNFEHSGGDVVYSKTLTLHRRPIISAIDINGTPYTNGSEVNYTIYYTDKDDPTYNGLSLELNVAPIDEFAKDMVIKYTADPNLVVTGEINEGNTIGLGKTMVVNFKENTTGEQNLKLKVDVKPTSETITVDVKLKNVVTSTKLVAYNANQTSVLIDDVSNPLFIDGNGAETYACIKAYYTGTQLDASSITATIEDCASGKITFGDDQKSTSLNFKNEYKIGSGSDSIGKYDIFKIPFVAKAIDTAKIKVQSGNGTINVYTVFNVSSVNVATTNDIKAVVTDETYATVCDEVVAGIASLNLALPVGGNTTLSFQGKLNNAWSSSVVQDLDCVTYNASSAGTDFASHIVEPSKYSNHELFVVASRFDQDSKTEILAVTLKVYREDEGVIALQDITVYVEVAVYCPVANITVTGATDIAYTNMKYDSNSSTILTFESKNASGRNASSSITFAVLETEEDKTVVTDTKKVEHVSQIKLKFSQDISSDEDIAVSLVDGEDETIKQIKDNQILIDASLNDLLTGRIKVQLKAKPQLRNNLKMTLVAMSLDKETTIIKNITINFDNFDPVDNVIINGTEETPLVRESMNSNYVYMSFMGTDENEIQAKLIAQAKYDSTASALRFNELDYVLRRVEQNDDGSIKLDANGNIILQELYGQDYFTVKFVDDTYAIIKVKKEYENDVNISGGIYELTIGAKDSYDDATGKFKVASSVFVSVSDGSVKNKYMLTNANFMDIGRNEDNLKANYVLYEDITISENFAPIGLIGDSVVPFNGKLFGTLETVSGNSSTSSRHSITYTVSRSVSTEQGLYAGLFAHLGENAELNGIDFYAKIKEDTTATYFTVANNKPLNLGAVAGYNKGTINNVFVYLDIYDDDCLTINPTNLDNGTFNFGGVVGVNDGEINLTDSTVIVEGVLNLGSENSNAKLNLGAVSGTNFGKIHGDYEGKSNLLSVKYNVINNLTIIDNSTKSATYNVGGVAGANIDGTISGLVVGGHLELEGSTNIKGSLTGVAGTSTGAKAKLDSLVLLGLDIINEHSTNVVVAGASANSANSQYTNIKVVSASVTYSNDALNLKNSTGEIKSVGLVAGIVANASSTDSIKLCSVENFISKVTTETIEADFYTLSAPTVYGIANVSNGSPVSSKIAYNFVTANLDGNEVWALATECENCYFIGKVKTTSTGVVHDGINTSTNYIIIITEPDDTEGIMYTYNGAQKNYFTLSDVEDGWENSFKGKTGFNYDETVDEGKAWRWETTTNSRVLAGLTVYFPYITVDGEPIMIVAPTEIVASLNSEYVENIDSVYVDLSGISASEITEVAIINYHYFEQDQSQNEKFNTYKITDLVDLQVVPTSANAGVKFTVVEGSTYARINDDKIIFTGVSGNGRIVVKCYSIFNPDEYEYVVFYTQYGLTNLTLDANDISTSVIPDCNYEINVINGAEGAYIQVGAENIFKDESFRTIFNSKNGNMQQFLKIEAKAIAESNLNIEDLSEDMFGKFLITLKDNVTVSSSENVEFELYLNITKYFGLTSEGEDEYIKIASSVLKVNLIMSAKSVEVLTGDVAGQTQATIPFDADLLTGYVGEAKIIVDVQTEGNVVKFAQEHDYINLTMEVLSGAEELETLMNNAGVQNIVELFDYEITSETIKTDDDKVVGFKYKGSFALKDEHNYRYIKSQIKLKVTVYANTNADVCDTFTITFNPTSLSTVRLNNYATTEESSNPRLTWIKKETETAIISPTKSGMIIVNLEPTYANVDLYDSNVDPDDIPCDENGNYLLTNITSDGVFVNSTGMQYILFEQLVYSTKHEAYMPLADASPVIKNADGDIIGIYLKAVSNWDADEKTYSYDGKIYLRTSLDSSAGIENTITVSLNVFENKELKPPKTKKLLTQYLPEASIEFNDRMHIAGNNYLVETDTLDNVVTLKLRGYEFKSRPNVTLSWVESDKLKDINLSDYVAYTLDDYKNVVKNPDGTYTLKLYLDVYQNMPTYFKVGEENVSSSFNISVEMSLITSDGLVETSNKESITLNPIKYHFANNGLSVENLIGNVLKVRSKNVAPIILDFATENSNRDYSKEIYAQLLEDIGGIERLKKAFTLIDKDGNEHAFDDLDSIEEIEVEVVRINNVEYLAIKGISDCNFVVKAEIKYAYIKNEDTQGYELKMFVGNENSAEFSLTKSFNVQVEPHTDPDSARTITSADQLTDSFLETGEHYILMQDIVVENFVPLTSAIASLDGNNKIITIKSFAYDAERTNYGLFDSIGTYSLSDGSTGTTLLKNVVVDYGSYDKVLSLTGASSNGFVFGGLVAQNNGGLIYNCETINFTKNNKEIKIKVDNDATLTFGGLVGINAGTITNSRVGADSFTKVSVDIGSVISENPETIQGLGKLAFTLGDIDSPTGFISSAGGLVGENSGIVASSYVANTSVISYSARPNESKLAGFVANNSGSVEFSYVRGDTDKVTSTSTYAKGDSKIESPTNCYVAGFVFTNSGTIKNSFANTILKTQSSLMAGFVYWNNGNISECYSACTLNEIKDRYDSSEQPFIGLDSYGEQTSTGTLTNCYYLAEDSSMYNIPSMSQKARGLSAMNFQNSANLNNFVFVLSNTKSEREEGVWSYYTSDSQSRILPELTTANRVAISYRYLISDETDEENSFAYAPSYEVGSINNPITISSAKEFNNLASMATEIDGVKTMVGYIRLISDVDFNNDPSGIDTRLKFKLGNKTDSVTSFEGNGMTISGIYLDANESEEDSLGLFAYIENAYIKNLELKYYNTKFSSKNTMYSGGLAGKISDSIIINVNLDGANTVINGYNFAGGVAGIIEGKSLLYGITSNLNAQTTVENSALMYFSKENYDGTMDYNTYLKQISYAGGIAGVLDVSVRNSSGYNLSYITINGGTSSTEKVLASHAGGVAGYANENVSALRLKYNVGAGDRIKGYASAGGLFGVFLGKMKASQVTAEENVQFDYDSEIASYVLNLSTDKDAVLDKSKIGNTTLIESAHYAGGLVGIGIGSTIDCCYSKATFYSGEIIGGLYGSALNTYSTQAYAVPYVNLDTCLDVVDVNDYYFGGAYGKALEINSLTGNETVYGQIYNNAFANVSSENKTNNIEFTFSTIILDNITLENVGTDKYLYEGKELHVGYLYANKSSNIAIASNSELHFVFVGTVDVPTEHGNSIYNHMADADYDYDIKIKLTELYDVDNSTVQSEKFNRIFSAWTTDYWNLNRFKYYPLLTNDEFGDYILIEDVNDFNKVLANPSGNFMVMNDIDMSSWETAHNYILYIQGGGFTGTMVGYTENVVDEEGNSRTPKITGLHIDAGNTSETGAGFFNETRGATIKNLEFVWSDNGNGAITYNNGITNLDKIGMVSASDNGSMFTALTVRAESNSAEGSNLGYFIKDRNVSNYGGVVAEAMSSTIMNCAVAGNVKATLSKASISNDPVYFGGVVGHAGQDFTENGTSMIANTRVFVDKTEEDEENEYVVDLTIGANASQVYVGGVAGYASTTTISTCEVGKLVRENGEDRLMLDIKVDFAEGNITTSASIGGVAGRLDNNSYFVSNSVVANILTTGELKPGSSTTGTELSVAGLCAEAEFSGNAISNNYGYVNIDADELTTTLLNISAGVAKAFGVNVEMYNCAFRGNLTATNKVTTNDDGTESISTASTITTINAGGVVATSSATLLNLHEVESFVDIVVGKVRVDEVTTYYVGTENVYVGGLVGKAEDKTASITLNVVNCATTGLIVPITRPLAEEEDSSSNFEIYIGGLAGKVDGYVSVQRTYSTSSLIVDKLGVGAYAKANVGALLGGIGARTEYDSANGYNFYSSDLSLSVEEKLGINGVNLSTSYLIGGSAINQVNEEFKNALASGETHAWNSVDGKLPYLVALKDSLIRLRLIDANGRYLLSGTSYNPEIIRTSIKAFAEEYTYYLLTDTIDNLQFTGVLNGVLIGAECEYHIGALTPTEDRSYYGLIGEVAQHSAVSNFHIIYDGENKDITTTTGTGLVVGYNNGIVFNCSVQGTGLTIFGGSTGLIVGGNSGLVNYCYSTAEILETNNLQVSGLVLSNNGGTIANSYFTGYIANETVGKAAGIVGTLGSDVGYVYNTYMAGVIAVVDISTSSNSFCGEYSDGLRGSKVFIDKLANVEYASNTDDNWINEPYTLTDTYSLMSSAVLNGNWHVVVSEDVILTDAGTFGYNYGYPIYNFNKHRTSNESLEMDLATTYSLYTGNGAVSDDVKSKIVDRYNTLTSASVDTENIFRIPHLGVLGSIQGLLNADKDLNYALIYDINGRMKNDYFTFAKWTPVGASGTNTAGFTGNTNAGFVGLFVSNKNYAWQDYHAEMTDEELCTITCLSEGGLFTNVGGTKSALFGDVVLGEFKGLGTSGPLGEDIINATYVANIFYTSNSSVVGENLSALFGSISSGSLYVLTDIDASMLKLRAEENVGSVVAVVNGGSIKGNNHTISFPEVVKSNMVGGVVGKSEASSVTVEMMTINFTKPIYTACFGGIIGNVDKVFTAKSIKLDLTEDFTLEDGVELFGVVSGKVSGTLTVENLDLLSDNPVFEVYGKNATTTGYGGLVGLMTSGGIKVTFANKYSPYLKVHNGVNVGGIVGNYQGGHIYINTNQFTSVIVSGAKNVGGWFGVYNCPDSVKLIGEGEEDEEFVFAPGTTFEPGFATITNRDLKSTVFANYGGLFGKIERIYFADGYACDISAQNKIIISDIGEDKDFTITNVGGVVGELCCNLSNMENETTITFEETVLSHSGVGYNIGGVIGYYNNQGDADVLTNLTNKAVINAIRLDVGNEENYVYSEMNTARSIQAVNVGGIVGYITGNGTTLNKVESTSTVSGYINVGAVVGYAENLSLGTPIPTIIESKEEFDELKESGEKIYIIGESGEFVETTEDWQEDKTYYRMAPDQSKISGKVVGVYNVGGAVGYAENSKITIVSSANVYGNTNVGGLVGNVGKDTIIDNSGVQKSTDGTAEETDIKVTVKGVIYSIKAPDTCYNVLPSSIGGLAGIVATDSGVLTNNKIYANIETATEGIVVENGKDTSTAISTINNYMLVDYEYDAVEDMSKGKGLKLITVDANNKSTVSEISLNKDYNQLKSGVGGYVGTMLNETLVSLSDTYVANVAQNSLSVDVNAPLGINVGAIYGYTVLTHSSAIQLPELLDDVKVDGAYNVGSIAGFIDCPALVSTNKALSDELLTKNVELQSGFVGMYVGGLIGKVESDSVSNLQLTQNKVTLHTSKVYYGGGLVGLFVVNKQEGTTFGPNGVSVGATADSKVLTIDDSQENFGGLIGMLKISNIGNKSTNKGVSVSVKGIHFYYFTINTIENQAYQEGNSQYDLDIDEDNRVATFYAQAYYINNDEITVQGSSNSVLFGNDKNNPLIELKSGATYKTGWAKEYSGFRKIQRCIPKEQNNGKWDSIAVIYDAANITGVAKANVAVKYDGEKVIYEEIIVYTIYEVEPDLGYAEMYTRYGIAELYQNEKGVSWFVNDNNKDTKNGVHELNIGPEHNASEVEDNKGFKKYGMFSKENKDNPDAGYAYHDFTIANIEPMTGSFSTPKEASDHSNDGTKKHFAFKITNNYMNRGTDGATVSYFEYKTKYGCTRSEETGDDGKVTKIETFDSKCFATSGSLLNSDGYVNDTPITNTDQYKDVKEAKDWYHEWGYKLVTGLVLAVGTAAAIFGSIFTGGTSLGAIPWLASLCTAISYAAVIGAGIAYLAGQDFANQAAATGTVVNNYFAGTTRSFGYRSNRYYRNITYQDDKLYTETDYRKIVNNQQYVIYSTTKPADYYSQYYILIKNVLNDDGTKIKEDADGSNQQPIYASYSDVESSTKNTAIGTAKGKDGKEVPEATFEYQTVKINNEWYVYFSKYIYSDGYYWINTTAADITYVKYNTFNFAEGDYKNNDSEPYVYNENGFTYAFGKFEGETYKLKMELADNTANMIKPKKNGEEQAQDAEGNNLYILDNGYKKKDGKNVELTGLQVERTATLNYVYDKSYETMPEDSLASLKNGYDYFQGAYYTVSGTENETLKMNAEFKYLTNDDSTLAGLGLTENVDYIKVPYYVLVTCEEYVPVKTIEDGSPDYKVTDKTYYIDNNGRYDTFSNYDASKIDNTEWTYTTDDGMEYTLYYKATSKIETRYAYYIIDSQTTKTADENISVNTKEEATAEDPDFDTTFVRTLYPATFINPYNNSKVSTPSQFKDNKFYSYASSETSDQDIIVQASVTYFLYEGGYKIIELNNKYQVGTKVEFDETSAFYLRKDLSEEDMVDLSKHSYVCAPGFSPLNGGNSGDTRLAWKDEYWNWYVYGTITKFSEMYDIHVTYTTDEKGKLITTTTYQANANYTIGMATETDGSAKDSNIIEGLVYVAVLNYPDINKSGNNNKYLSKAKNEFYTRYKYGDLFGDYHVIGSSDISKDDYSLLPPEDAYEGYCNSPNPGYITRLSETVMVSLSGYRDKDGNKNGSGFIKIT